jgi:hypothetical protein
MTNLISRIFVNVVIIAIVSLFLQFAFPSLTDKQAVVIGGLVSFLRDPFFEKY